MPQPDLLLLRLELDESAAPGPADVLLLVEVSESSLVYHQRDKLAAYARSGVAPLAFPEAPLQVRDILPR